MVQIHRSSKVNARLNFRAVLTYAIVTVLTSLLIILYCLDTQDVVLNPSSTQKGQEGVLRRSENKDAHKDQIGLVRNSDVKDVQGDQKSSCEYKSVSDLKSYELHPKVTETKDANNRRHAFQPPKDGQVTLVCCNTTAGPISIAVHHTWAPQGAERFLAMVRSKYFSSKVAFMRCVHNFLCQFGIAGNPKLNNQYKSISDDPNWLMEGPDFRTNDFGAFRYAKGYLAYAGSGKNSRSNQLIVALGDNKRLGGGSPWEVPFGEIVGSNSYDTLAKISTIYGEKGPSQGLLRKEGSSDNVMALFPELDYLTSCDVVDNIDMDVILNN